MGIFRSKSLPRTSYGYQPPPEATASGWKCPGPECGDGDEATPRRWPALCTACGTQVDPSFDEPWAHQARRLEIDHILRDPAQNSSYKTLVRVESDVWDYKDALMRHHASSASRARHAFRRTVTDIVRTDHYFVSGTSYFQVVLAGLEYADVDGVADELLTWYPEIDTRDVETDDARRFNSRYFISCGVRFLEDPRGSQQRDADKIYRAMLDIAARIKDVLTVSNEEGVTRVRAIRK